MNPIIFAVGMGLLGALAFAVKKSAPGPTPPTPTTTASLFIAAVQSFLGQLYEWGGGHTPSYWGLDCSGLILQALQKAGIKPVAPVYTADSMWRLLPKVTDPLPGDLALYGTEAHVHHVAVLTSRNPDGTWNVISAEGDQNDTTPAGSAARGHRVKERPTHRFMSDFLGFRRVLP
jgi:hypothetical protein